MATKAGKRPLRSLTAHEKLDAIRRVHDGESKASVARDIGVPESTLRGWCKNEDKISYLSRQSSPETDESEHKDKRIKLDETTSSLMQPFNLSLKPQIDYHMKNDHNLSTKAETPKSVSVASISERERNRAELARLSVELGLNRPEMFMPNMTNAAQTANLADLTANIGLLAQWNNLLLANSNVTNKSTNKKVTAPADTSSANNTGLLQTVLDAEKLKPPKEKQSVNDSVWYWLKTQQAMLGLNQQTPTSTQNSTPDQSSWFWKWYKQFAYNQAQIPQGDKPILYQQLTKEQNFANQQQNAENLSVPAENSEKSHNNNNNNNNKVRSVLDNLLFNNNNISVNKSEDDEDVLSQNEALVHGEKFLKWLEACSDPSVTAMQIMQFRSLLNNVKLGAERKNGDLQNKAKVKRK